MGNLYDEDVIAWAEQQAGLLRARQWSRLDIDNLAEEIADVGRSEKRELRHRLAVLIEHLIKWKWLPMRRGSSWLTTIRIQRMDVEKLLIKVPRLKRLLDKELADAAWRDAVVFAVREAEIGGLPDASPWSLQQILTRDFLPD
ncbi:DUF29 domain-containing protein [Duganella callida]|uniref:DUF29 domain-containing protein n=1 Tax=Duganella callida TaxID=2561932 RepID=A0A4Y9S3S5_9BURK|nr:DUF29 domain-containing protein [Duganella callida]TFW15805.1 DUF29 domain-containing protein [Duganella callida]